MHNWVIQVLKNTEPYGRGSYLSLTYREIPCVQKRFYPAHFAFSYKNHYLIALYCIYALFYQQHNQSKPGNLQKAIPFRQTQSIE